MNSKEKKNGKIIITITFIIMTAFLFFWCTRSNKQISYASNDESDIQISQANKVDIDKIINENTHKCSREEIIKEEIELEYITKYRNNNELLKGKTQVSQEGRNGIQQIIIQQIYDENNNLIKEEQIGATVVKASINKIIDVGTADKKIVEDRNIQNSSNSELSFDMALNKPSGFSQEQFKKALTDDKDRYRIFENNAEYFYLIEQQYNINGLFVAAVGIHESAWGTARIAQNKHNLFGYGAYDSNPYNGAYSFTNFSESIDLVARVFVKYYINPAGTKIYDGNEASGKYYNGNTLSAINKKYASDSNWAKSVYNHMQYLYSKI